ncbi:MAG: lipoate--protein ligase family protein [Candidatus Thermoplasmatota archaeon]|jgi:lipoate-protein ligase A|nr:lipoate--protein ligase family protein [Candidatus Thermoplasmatota archaeon]
MSTGVEWRVLRHERTKRSAAMNMGIDEAILNSVSEGRSPPTLRFYMWAPTAVSIGYFQGLELEVDLDECRKRGVDVVRRITGGGAVYHDTNLELTYSVVVKESSGLLPKDILGSYKAVCAGIIKGMERLGVKAEFRPLNDLVINGRKISGNAQTRRQGCILQHGTILMGVDVDSMFSVLKVPDEKLRGKMVEGVKASVTSLKQVLGALPDPTVLADAVEGGMTSTLPGKFVHGAISKEEEADAGRIARERYLSQAWTGKR